ncbi:MAG: hypothetical protein AAB426_12250, partial [Myxococcota bacterium]
MSTTHAVGLRIADVALTVSGPEYVTARLAAAWSSFVAPVEGLRIDVLQCGAANTMPRAPSALRDHDRLVLRDGALMELRLDLHAAHAHVRLWSHAADDRRSGLPMGLHNALSSLLATLLARAGGMLLHASSVQLTSGDAVLFLGPSGAGKSTIAAMFPRDAVLNDEL